MKQNEPTLFFKIYLMLGQIITGAFHTISVKAQNIQFSVHSNYHHPYIQVFFSLIYYVK